MTPRVVVVDHAASLSGAELFLAGMLEHTTRIDAAVVLLEDGPLRTRLEEAGIEVRVCALPGAVAGVTADSRPRNPGDRVGSVTAVPRFLARLRANIASLAPDVVYTNSAKAHVLAVPVARTLRRPVVMHLHDLLTPESFSGPNLRLLRATSTLATHVVTNSQATRATLPRRAVAHSSVVYCPTEIPDPATAPEPRAAPFSIAVVGRIANWKGQHLAVEALALLRRSGQPEATLHCYGAAAFAKDRPYQEELGRLIELRGLGSAVHLHGHVLDVTEAMRQHDVVVHTSVRPEPMGQVVLEAMAAGVPVVAAASGGPLELVEDGVSGVLYAMGDARELAHVVDRLAGDPDLRRRLAEGGLRRVADFSYGRLVPGWEDLITRVASRAR